ncbi:MAG: NAD-glutamate dehydrogenase, partial [bacterium]
MKNPVTEKLIAAIKKSIRPTPSATKLEFLSDYYHRISGQDFSQDRTPFLYQSALLHFNLAKARKPGQILIQTDNLMLHDNSSRTVVSIVTDDNPFIISSLTITLNHLNYRVERTLHPMFQVVRNSKHAISNIHRYRSGDVSRKRSDKSILESFIQFEIDAVAESEHKKLISALEKTLKNIAVVTSDWSFMRDAALSLADMVEQSQQGPTFAEYGALFRWMAENHFAFIGYCELEVSGKNQNIHIDSDSLSGILRAAHQDGQDILKILPPIKQSKTSPIIFTKSRKRVYIHRANYLDCILIDHDFDKSQRGTKSKRRVSCVLGFLAGSTTTMAISSIPHLRSKAAFILSESTLRKGSYAYKELRTILETLPREMIFQLDVKSLYSLCMTLLNQQERRRTRLHITRNICGHFFSCLVYVPRDLFNTELRKRVHHFLQETLNAQEVTFNVYFSESILTRIHFTAYCSEDARLGVAQSDLELAVQSMARDWDENLFVAAQNRYNLEKASELLLAWRGAFPASYLENFEIDNALHDIECFESLSTGQVNPRLMIPVEAGEQDSTRVHFRLYSPDAPIPLSDALPILDHMGVRVLGEHPYRIRRADGQEFWINDFDIVRTNGNSFSLAISAIFESAFENIWNNRAENDGFNQLTLLTGFDWRQVSMLRAYFRYLKQIRLRYSENYIIDSLVRNPELVRCIGELFDARFNPSLKKRSVNKTLALIKSLLSEVQTLDEERILCALLDVLNATLRTNFFQLDQGIHKNYISFKLNSRSIPRIPEPAPKYEIFVYSPRIEGVHLRGGDVARGGLRWSERPEDFRTEVLGLVKAQRVKNAVIVPVGSKGGFVAKSLPETNREDIQAEVVACYRIFISALLDVTDNIVKDCIVPPSEVVRLDKDDPYLVVAADKGTATFSDIANSISEDYGFWLGDAFASGGSAGYDHKKMGITARGAWESVKRHFRELGKDIQSQDFTAVGIGDMGGDVFGNGMLLSKNTRLVAAFNHMHIFIDPNPNAKSSYLERQRLFDLPRSSWTDYNTKLISKGGGIYERSAKSIKLTAQAKSALSADKDSYTPDELINVILKSEVELLWNGGIGTYVKSSSETHQDAQDRNNDNLRVDSDQLRVKVIGEGGNLGMTQLARIEFNRNGGLCYTDAIDNSAGVDTSDHEVNIKILLNAAVESKKLALRSRNPLLAKMETDVAQLVLHNNYIQTQILSLETSFGAELMPQQIRSIHLLEQKGLLDREIEYLPDEFALDQRQESGDWLTRAELAVLLSYSKMDLYQSMLDSDVPDDPHLKSTIEGYFPHILVSKFSREIHQHRLKREIISTVITNDLVGMLGANFHLRVQELTGSSIAEIIRAYIIASEILDLTTFHQTIKQLDNKVKANLQKSILRQASLTAESVVIWLLRNRPSPLEITVSIKEFKSPMAQLETAMSKLQSGLLPVKLSVGHKQTGVKELSKKAVQQLQLIEANAWACDILDISFTTRKPINLVVEVFFRTSKTLGLSWVNQSIDDLPVSNDWNQRARFSLSETLRSVQSKLTKNILESSKSKNA